jgi:CBS domain-containing protein
MRVDEIMSRRVISVAPAATVADALDLFLTSHVLHLVVIEEGRVAGVVGIREASGKSRDLPVAKIMIRDIKTAAPTTTIRDAARLIIGRNAGCLPVVDAGRVVGIVTAADLMRVVREKADTGAPTAHGAM